MAVSRLNALRKAIVEMSLADKVVLLTGACSGIGTATAEIFAKLEAKVVLVGRNVENLKAAEELCKSVNENFDCLVIGTDITEHAASIVEQTLKHFGRLDILINCGGVLATGGILDIDIEQFDHVLNINLRSIFLMTKLAVPHLIESQGSIINVSSVISSQPNPSSISHSVSKAALDQFTQCIALELAPKKVRVYAVDPSVVLADLQKRADIFENELAEHLSKTKDAHITERLGSVEETAKAIVYLASGETITL